MNTILMDVASVSQREAVMSSPGQIRRDCRFPESRLQSSRCCKLTYKPRRFASKGATLTLFWNFTIFATINNPPKIDHETTVSTVVNFIALAIAALISAWLAETYVGRHRVVHAGVFLLWLGNLLSASIRVMDEVPDVNPKISYYLSYPSSIAIYAGEIAILINIIQYGIEQMPDASAEQITSFISWFVFTIPAGVWIYFVIHTLCEPFQSLAHQTLLTVLLCSQFIFRNWLISHHKTHNPLKIVYRVLKYAKQHKIPVNRSAFTYWEEEIPSRIDLGKTKYGGPFTTEEVEDVKTLLRIIAILSALGLFVAACTFTYYCFHILHLHIMQSAVSAAVPSTCIQVDIHGNILNNYFEGVVIILLYEFVLYPIFKHHLPQMLTRIGTCMLTNVGASLIILILAVLTHYIPSVNAYLQTRSWIPTVVTPLLVLLLYILVTAIIEFINAQSPESMKGFTSAIMYLIVFSAFLLGAILNVPLIIFKCTLDTCAIVAAAASVLLSIVTCVFYCLVARWYKRREREDLFNGQAIIEDIYSRRVEQNDIEEFR